MSQAELSTASSIQLERPVNVSSVPQRSPFRYPGGKTWFVPTIRKWLSSLSSKPKLFVEPFAGGGIVSLTVAFEDLAEHITLIELDDDVASVWEVVFNGNARALAERIRNYTLNQSSVRDSLGSVPRTQLERAFQTILRNRVQHGGILAPGASLMKEGENGKGLASRWYPETLARRILDIDTVSNRINFLHGDGLEFIRENVANGGVFFIDPPYTITGKRLYSRSDLDHAMLFGILAESDCEFLMTYDKSTEIEALAKSHGFAYEEVLMQGRLNQRKTELVITRDLAWAHAVPLDALPFP